MLVRLPLILLLAALALPAAAQAPRTIAFQGVLADGGAPVTTSTSVTFRLFDAASGGTQWWEETQTVAPDAGGAFSVRLGSVTALDSAFAEPLWLDVAVAGTALGPRTPLDAAPYALGLYGLRTAPPATGEDAPSLVAGHESNAVVPSASLGRLFGFEGGATVSGGGAATTPNRAGRDFGTVGGGVNNEATGNAATVGGGASNDATGSVATVGGGVSNEASGSRSTVSGGSNNDASGEGSAVSGGGGNVASAYRATVSGGDGNVASGSWSVVGGGLSNVASERSSSVPGGFLNHARGEYSLAAGTNARAIHDGSFVWSDASTDDPPIYPDSLLSTAPNQFLIRAAGGVGIGTNEPRSRLHIERQDVNLQTSALESEELIVEATDAVAGLYSNAAGTWGSALALGEIGDTGALVNKWGIARRTGGSGGLYFTFGTGANYANNDAQMRIDTDGSVHADGSFIGGGADLAEYFPLLDGATVEAGQVVGLRGGRVSLSTRGAEQVAVVSSDPAFVGNPDAKDGGALVALVGQVTVRLANAATVGDHLVASGRGDGTARAVAIYDPASDGPVVGRVLRVDGTKATALVGVDEAAALRAVVSAQGAHLDGLQTRLDAQTVVIEALTRRLDAVEGRAVAQAGD